MPLSRPGGIGSGRPPAGGTHRRFVGLTKEHAPGASRPRGRVRSGGVRARRGRPVAQAQIVIFMTALRLVYADGRPLTTPAGGVVGRTGRSGALMGVAAGLAGRRGPAEVRCTGVDLSHALGVLDPDISGFTNNPPPGVRSVTWTSPHSPRTAAAAEDRPGHEETEPAADRSRCRSLPRAQREGLTRRHEAAGDGAWPLAASRWEEAEAQRPCSALTLSPNVQLRDPSQLMDQVIRPFSRPP